MPSQTSKSRTEVFEPGALLFSREATRHLLGGISIASVKRLEHQGELTPVRLNKQSASAQVFYRRAEVFALAQADGANNA